MANKRYYWLKLNENYFERTEVMAMLAQKNGSEIAVIYLRLMMMGINSDGLIEYEHIMPNLTSEIALKLHCKEAAVSAALEFFSSIGVAEVTEEAVKLLRMDDIVGSETDSTIRSRLSRSKNSDETTSEPSATTMQHPATTMQQQCNTDIDIDIEKDTDIDTDIDTDRQTDTDPQTDTDRQTEDYGRQVVAAFNRLCPSMSKVTFTKGMSDSIRKARDYLGSTTFEELFARAGKSVFLNGGGEKHWFANFKWLLQPQHIDNLLAGNYDSPQPNKPDYSCGGKYPNALTDDIPEDYFITGRM